MSARLYEDENTYIGQDAAGNLHLHVDGECYTNGEIGAAIKALKQKVEDLEYECMEIAERNYE